MAPPASLPARLPVRDAGRTGGLQRCVAGIKQAGELFNKQTCVEGLRKGVQEWVYCGLLKRCMRDLLQYVHERLTSKHVAASSPGSGVLVALQRKDDEAQTVSTK
jgi:hypothetical protein